MHLLMQFNTVNLDATVAKKWPLSQDANKAFGICSVCRATRQLHLKDGTVHKHGPRDRPCPGSNKPPLSTATSIPQSVDTAQAVAALTSVITSTDQPQSSPLRS